MAAVNRNNVTSTSPLGQSVAGSASGGGKGYGIFGGRKTSSGAYEPTIVALIVLILLEFAAYAGLRYTFKSVHGG